jgi:hypothetical protein
VLFLKPKIAGAYSKNGPRIIDKRITENAAYSITTNGRRCGLIRERERSLKRKSANYLFGYEGTHTLVNKPQIYSLYAGFWEQTE